MTQNIFNFQTYNCFNLQACEHETFFEPLSEFTEISVIVPVSSTDEKKVTFLHQKQVAL